MTISMTLLREEWLMRAVVHLEPIFQRGGYQIPRFRTEVVQKKCEITIVKLH
jgi:hypothetical protein